MSKVPQFPQPKYKVPRKKQIFKQKFDELLCCHLAITCLLIATAALKIVFYIWDIAYDVNISGLFLISDILLITCIIGVRWVMRTKSITLMTLSGCLLVISLSCKIVWVFSEQGSVGWWLVRDICVLGASVLLMLPCFKLWKMVGQQKWKRKFAIMKGDLSLPPKRNNQLNQIGLTAQG